MDFHSTKWTKFLEKKLTRKWEVFSWFYLISAKQAGLLQRSMLCLGISETEGPGKSAHSHAHSMHGVFTKDVFPPLKMVDIPAIAMLGTSRGYLEDHPRTCKVVRIAPSL